MAGTYCTVTSYRRLVSALHAILCKSLYSVQSLQSKYCMIMYNNTRLLCCSVCFPCHLRYTRSRSRSRSPRRYRSRSRSPRRSDSRDRHRRRRRRSTRSHSRSRSFSRSASRSRSRSPRRRRSRKNRSVSDSPSPKKSPSRSPDHKRQSKDRSRFAPACTGTYVYVIVWQLCIDTNKIVNLWFCDYSCVCPAGAAVEDLDLVLILRSNVVMHLDHQPTGEGVETCGFSGLVTLLFLFIMYCPKQSTRSISMYHFILCLLSVLPF